MIYNPGRDLVIRTTIACGVLETVAVILRFVARWKSQAAFKIDDWVLAASLFPSYCMLANGMVMVTKGGAGRHVSELSPKDIEVFMKVVTSSLVTYSVTITMVRISILLLYRRVFDTKKIKVITSIFFGVAVAWGIIAVLCLLFQCHPLSNMWKPEYTFTNKCLDLGAYYAGVSGSNMALDLLLIAMPLYMIWGLGLPSSQKIGLTLIFLLGGLGCVASLMRIITVHFIKGADLPYTVVTPYIWSQIEPTTAIICACLTTYRPLFKGLNLRSLSRLTWLSSEPSKIGTTDDSATVCSDRRSQLLDKDRASEQWSKFDFTEDSEGKQHSIVSSVHELRTFQDVASQGTGGGLRLCKDGSYGHGDSFKVDVEAQLASPTSPSSPTAKSGMLEKFHEISPPASPARSKHEGV